MNSCRQNVIDQLNNSTFCSYLEVTGTVYPGGNRVPCCKASGVDIGAVSVTAMSYQEYQQSNILNAVKQSLENRDVAGYCRSCIAVENQGINSDRINNNQNWIRYLEQTNEWAEFEQSIKNKHNGPMHWMLFLDNTCQARCVMCDSAFSTAIEKEYQKLDIPVGFMTKIKPQQQASTQDIQQIISDIKSSANNIKSIQLLGGEPTLQQPCQDILQWLIDNDHSQNIMVKVNTNGISINQSWLNMAQHFKSWQWTFSVDAVGDLNTWIRYPTRWSSLLENIQSAINSGATVIIKTTVHALNIHFLPELWQWTQQQNLHWIYHFVEDPQDISVAVLTQEQRNQLIDKYKNYPDFMKSHGPDLLQFVNNCEVKNQTPLIDFIQTLTPRRPGPFDQVNPYFTGLSK
jgi:pyruvate-formate lyase-activating enzyme